MTGLDPSSVLVMISGSLLLHLKHRQAQEIHVTWTLSGSVARCQIGQGHQQPLSCKLQCEASLVCLVFHNSGLSAIMALWAGWVGANARVRASQNVSPANAAREGPKLCTCHHWYIFSRNVCRELHHELSMSADRLLALGQYRVYSHAPLVEQGHLSGYGLGDTSLYAICAALMLLATTF